jgi:hypothetical protein
MPIETAEDMNIFFDADDFGTEVSAVIEGVPFSFNAIFTDAEDPASPGIRASITTATPRLICRRVDGTRIKRDQPVTVNSKNYLAKSIESRGAVATIFLKET